MIVHVPEFTAASGNRVSFDLDVPAANLPLPRKSLQFRLKSGQGGSVLGGPGASAEELREILLSKYTDRLASIDGQPVP